MYFMYRIQLNYDLFIIKDPLRFRVFFSLSMKVTVKQSKYYLKQLEFGIHVHRSFGADDDMILCKHEGNVSFVFF